jgi:multicomponent Na+:H+ antiporter subunit G
MSLIFAAFAAAPDVSQAAEAASYVDWWGAISNIGTVVSMVAGLFFIMAGTIGVLRLPDFYTRLHAAGMTDTLGAELILLALIFQCDNLQMVLKLLLVAFFLLIASPTATHAVAHAAYRAGLKPLLGEYRAPKLEEDAQ